MSLRIIEVSPRDGLQNEATPIPTDAKLDLVRRLEAAGLHEIELTSFVSPKWVPQLADAAELWQEASQDQPIGALYSALVPNVKGLERAVSLGVKRIAVFTAASDAFTGKNINMTVAESLDAFAEVIGQFRAYVPEGGWVRGYVSTAFDCPYSGKVEPTKVLEVCRRLEDLGVDEISIGDTIGVAIPSEVRDLIRVLASAIPISKLCMHFHDTRGTGVANFAQALEMGIQAFDASAGGLGGCPYAPGAGGNVATEDLVYFLERSGVKTGIDLEKLARATLPVLDFLGRQPASRVQRAVLAGSPPK